MSILVPINKQTLLQKSNKYYIYAWALIHISNLLGWICMNITIVAGNSEYVVKKITNENERVISIQKAIDNSNYEYKFKDGENLWIVTPIYNWTLASTIEEFSKKLVIKYNTKPYVCYVGIFGTTTGADAITTNKIMKEKGLAFRC